MATFRDIVCERMAWDHDQYIPEVFRRCLYGHALPLARLIQLLNSRFFEPDFQIIERIGSASTALEFEKAMRDFHMFNVHHQKTFRCRWGFRVSGRKLGQLHSDICGQPLAQEHTAFFTR